MALVRVGLISALGRDRAQRTCLKERDFVAIRLSKLHGCIPPALGSDGPHREPTPFFDYRAAAVLYIQE